MSKVRKYTVIDMVCVGYSRVYIPKVVRVRTANLAAYIERHELDPAFIFEGWPKLEGRPVVPEGGEHA